VDLIALVRQSIDQQGALCVGTIPECFVSLLSAQLRNDFQFQRDGSIDTTALMVTLPVSHCWSGVHSISSSSRSSSHAYRSQKRG
jgi:hypothetical protein